MRAPVQGRYAVVGLAFLALAGVRAAQDAPVWAAVFAAAAAVNAWLAVHEARPGKAAAPAAPVDAARIERSRLDRSLDGYRTSARQWQVLGFAGLLVGGGLLFLEPGLAVLAGAAALFAVHRAHRAGRALATLRRVAAVSR